MHVPVGPARCIDIPKSGIPDALLDNMSIPLPLVANLTLLKATYLYQFIVDY